MQVAFHLGAYSTEADRLVRLLAANGPLLDREGIFIPAPAGYRYALRDTLVALKGRPASPEIAEGLVMTCTGHRADAVARLILPQGGFLAGPDRVVTAEGLYPLAGERVAALANLFPEAEAEFHFTLINPGLMLSTLVGRQQHRNPAEVAAGLPPEAMLWSPVVARIAEAAAGRRVVVWCNEDLPLILPEAARLLGAIPPDVALEGEDALLADLMVPEGIERLRAYLAGHPPRSVAQRRKIVTAFLDKYARSEMLEAEIPLPGWTAETSERVADAYADDVARIAAMPGVTFVAP